MLCWRLPDFGLLSGGIFLVAPLPWGKPFWKTVLPKNPFQKLLFPGCLCWGAVCDSVRSVFGSSDSPSPVSPMLTNLPGRGQRQR